MFDKFPRLETTLKGDDKLIDSKKALLKKREEEIVKETKAAADKKVLYGLFSENDMRGKLGDTAYYLYCS